MDDTPVHAQAKTVLRPPLWDKQFASRVLDAKTDLVPVVPTPLSEQEISDIDNLLKDVQVHPSRIVVELCARLGHLPYLLSTRVRGVGEKGVPLRTECTVRTAPIVSNQTKQDPGMTRHDICARLYPYNAYPSSVNPPAASTGIFAGGIGFCTHLQQGLHDPEGGPCKDGLISSEGTCPDCGMPIFGAFYNLIALTQVGSHRTSTETNYKAGKFSAVTLARQIDLNTRTLLNRKGFAGNSAWVDCERCQSSFRFSTAMDFLESDCVMRWVHALQLRFDQAPYEGRWFIPSRHFLYSTLLHDAIGEIKKPSCETWEILRESSLERLGVRARVKSVDAKRTFAIAEITEPFELQEEDADGIRPVRHIAIGHTLLIVPNALPSDLQGTDSNGRRTITFEAGESVICGVFSERSYAIGREGDLYADLAVPEGSESCIFASFVIPNSVYGILRSGKKAQRDFASVSLLDHMYCRNVELAPEAGAGKTRAILSKHCGIHEKTVLELTTEWHALGAPVFNNVPLPVLCEMASAKAEWLDTYLDVNYKAHALLGAARLKDADALDECRDWPLRVANDTLKDLASSHGARDPTLDPARWIELSIKLKPFFVKRTMYKGMEKLMVAVVRGFVKSTVHSSDYPIDRACALQALQRMQTEKRLDARTLHALGQKIVEIAKGESRAIHRISKRVTHSNRKTGRVCARRV